jgi:hypothetical protein
MTFDRSAAADLWRNTLSQIPTTFGRLIYLSSLRDQNTGTYQHHGLAQLFGEGETDQTLRHSHSQTFSEWLCFNLEQQKSDLEGYLEELHEDKRPFWPPGFVWPHTGISCRPARVKSSATSLRLIWRRY